MIVTTRSNGPVPTRELAQRLKQGRACFTAGTGTLLYFLFVIALPFPERVVSEVVCRLLSNFFVGYRPE